eukprot:CAMPEP_0117059272 /NCGR_PEP_ID=MMETSP0472-20121206/41169_1 /TAXON_ID=693140 ORGANISM="Tiarina fusus, Strain LIS" /NCGR_SAMPLE_ID=MMETSP0472 /ASSEMBLY_ACC=CAM_ASM_000603 /LENGTH=717 /DNA_ID=CAMNT_0004776909 /DNA_START=333 /DNA_END=2486 /DNA_ORIENTATION=+
MPVANPDKVRKRNKNNSNSELFPEDDFNQSYVFDANEDVLGRQEDEKAEAARILRQKKRELESQYGSKQQQQQRPKKNLNNSNPQNTVDTLDMNTSDDSIGIENLTETFSNDESKKKKKKKKRRKSQQLDDPLVGEMSRNETFNRSKDSVDFSLNSGGARRVVKMRDTERLIRKGNGLQRQDSFRPNNNSHGGGGGGGGAGLQRQDSNRPSMNGRRQNSADFRQHGPHGGTMVVRQDPPQARGRPTVARANTARPGTMRQRSSSLDPSGHHRSDGNIGYHHAGPPPQRRTRSQSYDRSQSHHGGLARQHSYSGPPPPPPPPPPTRSRSMQRPPQTMAPNRPGITRTHSNSSTGNRRATLPRDGSTTVIKQGNKTVYLVPMTAKEAAELKRNPNNFAKGHPYGKHMYLRQRLQVEETPPRSLVLIWAIVMAELGFDLGTTIIAFRALLGEGKCCGQPMQLGPIPMSVTSPFFLLVVAELVFLCRAVVLTLWPSILTNQDHGDGHDYDEERALQQGDKKKKKKRGALSFLYRSCCCCLKWNARALLKILNFLVLLNPFFGCVIAWILLYQSDKVEAFTVLGLEGGSIILHFVSVYLEGGLDTCGSLLFHCIPIVPFTVSVVMILIYLQYGGVCYLVERNNFFYWGCEICDNGWPPVNGTCTVNGTNITIPVNSNNIFDIDITNDLEDLKDQVLATTTQGRYCQVEHPGGPPGDFCFFDF